MLQTFRISTHVSNTGPGSGPYSCFCRFRRLRTPNKPGLIPAVGTRASERQQHTASPLKTASRSMALKSLEDCVPRWQIAHLLFYIFQSRGYWRLLEGL